MAVTGGNAVAPDLRVVVAGEGMLELSRSAAGWQLGHGGDTLNTAIHLARQGIPTGYFTALGTDPFSRQLRADWTAEGLDTSLILTAPERNPGLYAIDTAPNGERSFTYWRGESAARTMFDCPDAPMALDCAASADLLVYSLISLAILPEASRHRLVELAARTRANGGRVAFDGNYRPRLWKDAAEARHWRDAAIAQADIGLPTLEDEIALGTPDAASTAAHWRDLGCGETVVKLGAEGCLLPDGVVVPPPAVLAPVDTSGAGDAFNAGYLAARLRGSGLGQAAQSGHDLAGWTIMRRGAIPPREA